jgi:hypothetical protein
LSNAEQPFAVAFVKQRLVTNKIFMQRVKQIKMSKRILVPDFITGMGNLRSNASGVRELLYKHRAVLPSVAMVLDAFQVTKPAAGNRRQGVAACLLRFVAQSAGGVWGRWKHIFARESLTGTTVPVGVIAGV